MLAFADDIMVVVDTEDEMTEIIEAMTELEESFMLILNKKKTVIMSDKKELKGRTDISGIKVVLQTKYLGM